MRNEGETEERCRKEGEKRNEGEKGRRGKEGGRGRKEVSRSGIARKKEVGE